VQRHLENLGDFGLLDAIVERRLDDADKRRDQHPARNRTHSRKTAQNVDQVRRDADLFVRLAQRGMQQRRVGRIDAAARKRDLAAMALDRIGAANEYQMQIGFALDKRDEHRSRAGRAFMTKRLGGLIQRAAQVFDLRAARDDERLLGCRGGGLAMRSGHACSVFR
jgi:hypothetical protein